jgi:sugar lactone lactonase YvrE
LDYEGNIYAARYYSSTVTKITPSGQTSIFAGGFTNPNGITFDKNYDLYVPNSTGHIIHKVTLDGVVDTFMQITSPHALLFDNEGSLYIAHYPSDKISKIDTAGNQSTFWTGSGLNGPIGMQIDSEGNFFAGNFDDGKIFKRTPGGTITQIGDIPGWMGFMVLAGDAIYATAFQQHKIYKVPIDGSGQSVYAGTGAAGQNDGSIGSATFNGPNGITATSTGDTLYISDYETRSLRMITGVNDVTNVEDDVDLPDGFNLKQNYPNPFNPTTKIEFRIQKPEFILLKVYDVLGNEITTLINERKLPGEYTVEFDANGLSSGIYYYRLQSGDFVESKKMLLLK